jgi:hypothetical protein
MILEEDVLWLKSISEIHINIKNKHNISLQLKEHIRDNMYFVEEKQQFQQETFYLSIKFHKVQQFAIFNHLLEIKDLIQDAQEPMQQL